MRFACASVGLSPERPELLREGENAVWRVKPGVIARVIRSGDILRVQRELQIAHWLAGHDFPAVRPVPKIAQPVIAGNSAVTFWEDIGSHAPGRSPQVAELLRGLHSLPQPTSFDPGRIDPFIRLEERIHAARGLDATERGWLLGRVRELREGWDRVSAGLARCVVHGDAWIGNIAQLPSGGTLLMDLERSGVGPPEWDLVSTAIKLTSFGWISPTEYREFCELYGSDVTAWAGFSLLRDIRELRMATYALQRAGTVPTLNAEARLRVRCLRGLEGPRPWAWRSTG